MLIKDILMLEPQEQRVSVRGWVRTKREMKNLGFIEINDGSCLAGVQCTYTQDSGAAAQAAAQITTGAAVIIDGTLVPSPAKGQASEVVCDTIKLIGASPVESYPLQKKHHTLEFLRTIPHLRGRSRTIGAVMRIRNRLSYAVHTFFQERGFLYLHTPIITTNDAEGAGSMFQVTTLDPQKPAGAGGEAVDYKNDFFGKKAYLTVSGQLEGETYALALSRIYTFGPTFRAENSNTARHLAEFWMIEPEAAFSELPDNMVLAEEFLKHLFTDVLKNCADDMAFFNQYIEKGIIQTLEAAAEAQFVHIPYTDAIRELEKKADVFEFKPDWGCDLQTEHEKFLTETVAGKPVIVTDYPKEIKAFYMKQNDDGKTVRAMDVLVPRLGEIIGGSEREADVRKLEARMKELGMNTDEYSWYLDLRRFGSVPHSGFGLGFERLVQYITGMANIRDCIPYPRG
ncbi:MAG: asparagine--tRNA ligase [Spirochaetaceae bacterium]|nr:asparagine--tRNA ligase [Spirochaetaceae bacterium]